VPAPPAGSGTVRPRRNKGAVFAALDVKAGTVIGRCFPRHRASEFRKFLDEIDARVPPDLDIHLVLDNAGTHKTKLIRDWLAEPPRLCRRLVGLTGVSSPGWPGKVWWGGVGVAG
jgi:DDE superfamily endonuclease